MSDLQKWLDEERAIWTSTERQALAALRAVVELHKPVLGFGGPGTSEDCNHCHVAYPCPTIRAIEKAVLK